MSALTKAKELGLVKKGDTDARQLFLTDPARAKKLAEFIQQNKAALVKEIAKCAS